MIVPRIFFLTIREIIVPFQVILSFELFSLDNRSNFSKGSISKCHHSRLLFIVLDVINPEGSILVNFSLIDIDDVEGRLVIVVLDLDMGVNRRLGLVLLAAGAFEPLTG